jgi:hypothetical protein
MWLAISRQYTHHKRLWSVREIVRRTALLESSQLPEQPRNCVSCALSSQLLPLSSCGPVTAVQRCHHHQPSPPRNSRLRSFFLDLMRHHGRKLLLLQVPSAPATLGLGRSQAIHQIIHRLPIPLYHPSPRPWWHS